MDRCLTDKKLVCLNMKGDLRRKTPIFYEQEAQFYDEMRFSSDIGRLIDRKQREIVMGLRCGTENVILEVGTGTGRFTIDLVRNSNLVVGIDVSRRMLMLARHRSVQEGLDKKMQLIRADAHQLPFRSNVFDLCVTINVLNHIEDYVNVMKQIQIVLKANGSLVANFPNVLSLYLPVALLVRFRKQSIIREVYSRWFTYKEITVAFSSAGMTIDKVKGFLLPPHSLPKMIIPLLKVLMKISMRYTLKYISPILFVRGVKLK